jgi:cytidylate kinase
VIENLGNRDRIDSSRDDSPLRKAEGAIEIDTSNLTFDEQVNKILVLVRELIG